MIVKKYLFINVVLGIADVRSYGVMAITLDFESNNPSSNLGRTFPFLFLLDEFPYQLEQTNARSIFSKQYRHKDPGLILSSLFSPA